MKFQSAHSGVTLIELITGMAVLLVLMALAAPSYNQWLENSRVRTLAESIQQGLQLARAEAVKRNTQVQFVMEDDLSWYIGCVVPNDDDDDDDGRPDCPAEIQTKSSKEAFANSTTVTFTPGDTSIAIFSGFGRVAKAPAAASFEQIELSTTALEEGQRRDLRVILGAGGSVRMCDPALPVTDARACEN